MLGYDTLMNYFKTNFVLMDDRNYSLYDIETMIPWERLVYMDLLRQKVKKQSEENRDQAFQNRRR